MSLNQRKPVRHFAVFAILGGGALVAALSVIGCGPPSPQIAAEASVDDGPIGLDSQENPDFVDSASLESSWGTEVAGQ